MYIHVRTELPWWLGCYRMHDSLDCKSSAHVCVCTCAFCWVYVDVVIVSASLYKLLCRYIHVCNILGNMHSVHVFVLLSVDYRD